MKPNNIDLTVIAGILERGKQDPTALKIHKRVEGTWNFAQGAPAFTATMAHGTQTTTLHVDIAPGFGGAGLAPDPLQYMLLGLGSCYAATVVTIAALENTEVTDLQVIAESHADVSSVYDIADNPLMERVSVIVKITADVDDDTLNRWQQSARDKCPFAYTVMSAVPLETRIERA
ncbi:OsmC family peroxiredoxin [Cryobacterium fucosi]|uniref:OsmC family peroxiredoxin n=2 Tax=Cryobacterium fucosi TaxID=1259157 RepID=A0A4R9B6Z6_9MICO|nr:OsmC family peroxiredoxin [Cryobacterium fucosi]